MITDQQSHLAFHLTGALTGGALHAVDGRKLVPALLAGYRDLTGLRYDFPAVLLRDDANQPFASLSDVIEALISKLAAAGEDEPRVRKQLLRLEREIRSVVAAGPPARFPLCGNMPRLASCPLPIIRWRRHSHARELRLPATASSSTATLLSRCRHC